MIFANDKNVRLEIRFPFESRVRNKKGFVFD